MWLVSKWRLTDDVRQTTLGLSEHMAHIALFLLLIIPYRSVHKSWRSSPPLPSSDSFCSFGFEHYISVYKIIIRNSFNFRKQNKLKP